MVWWDGGLALWDLAELCKQVDPGSTPTPLSPQPGPAVLLWLFSCLGCYSYPDMSDSLPWLY